MKFILDIEFNSDIDFCELEFNSKGLNFLDSNKSLLLFTLYILSIELCYL